MEIRQTYHCVDLGTYIAYCVDLDGGGPIADALGCGRQAKLCINLSNLSSVTGFFILSTTAEILWAG